MFLGIDESNHGRFPEIFVGTYSPNISYLRKGNFGKQRAAHSRKFRDIPYWHLMFTKTSADIVGKVNIPIIAVCELVLYSGADEAFSKVFIDGELTKKQVNTIERILEPLLDPPEIILAPNMDRSMKLVNEADNRANYLFRYYTRTNKRESAKNKYINTLITPLLEEYGEYLL